MVEMAQLISKVLVLDEAAECRLRIKEFCDANHLLGLRAQSDNLMTILKSNVDLGAIFLSEDHGREAGDGLKLATEIRRVRPELPIFLRRRAPCFEEASGSGGALFCYAYSIENIDKLSAVINSSIFSQVYPNAMVRGITEITKSALESQFKNIEVITEPPYIVRDRIIYGELFTLIPLESNWCRGYMMLQTEEGPLTRFVECGKTYVVAEAPTFRDINQVLGEVTNLAWGAFKSRFIAYEELTGRLSQVPIVVNHLNRYISFGSEDPQLCFKYTLTDTQGAIPPLVLFQRFVFNMNWSPDNFKENDRHVDDLVESGELEFF